MFIDQSEKKIPACMW